MNKRSINRRTFVSYSAAIGAGAAVAAHTGDASARRINAAARSAQDEAGEVTYSRAIDAIPDSFSESPMLTEMVDAGTIPPVEERLPEDPLVVEPIEVGQYGGLARVGEVTTRLSGGDIETLAGHVQNFLRYTPDLNATEPNIAKSVEVSDDDMTYTIHLRRGMKWSDGQPYTSADMMFAYEDILLNEELVPEVPEPLRPGGEIVKISAPDDYSLIFSFAAPNPKFLLSNLPHKMGWWEQQNHPAHYLQQFHPNHNPDAAAEAEAEGYNSWYERFSDLANVYVNPELPTLAPFIVEQENPTVVQYRRNPYYWVVDSQGNQLPYLDRIEMERLQDFEPYHAKIVTGEYDFASGHTTVPNYTTYEASAEDGDYTVLLWSSGRGAEVFFQVNMNVEDPVLRDIHQDVRYRQALSVAINRDEINELLFFGEATPRQMTVLPTSVHFKQEYADSWAQFDTDQANALLDDMGLEWNEDRTIRVRPDGEPLRIFFDYSPAEGLKTPIVELVTSYWGEIGVEVTAEAVSGQILAPRVENNEESMSLWHGDAATDVLLPVDPKWSVGSLGGEVSSIAPLWLRWFETDGEEGEEPPELYLEQLTAFVNYGETLDPEYAEQLLQSQAENLWSIGTVGVTPLPVIAKNHLGNVPMSGVHVWDGLMTYPYHPETFFIRQS